MSAPFFTICEQILSATANAVYQGLVILLFVALAMRGLKGANAATRHAVWFTLLLVIAALVPAHLLLTARGNSALQPASEVVIPEPVAPDPPAMVEVPVEAEAEGADAGPALEVDSQSGLPGFQQNAVSPLDTEDLSPAPTPPPFLTPAPAALPLGISDPNPALPPTPRPWDAFLTCLKSFFAKIPTSVRLPHSVTLALIGGWALLACIRGAKILARLLEIRRAKTSSVAPSLKLQQLFDQLAASLRAPRSVGVRLSNSHASPMALGFVHPVVLLPAEMDEEGQCASDAETEHVLRHELAHMERRDDWGNLVQHVIEAALFFHPAIWWISPRLSLEREIACDDHVLEASGRPRGYAITLANAASRMAGRSPLLAPGVSGNSSQLQQRISMILNTHRNRSSRLARRWLGFFATAAATLAALAIVAGPRLVLADATNAELKPGSPDVADGTPAALPGTSAAEAGPRSKPGDANAVPIAAPPPLPPTPEAPEAPEPPEPPEPPEAPEVAEIAPMPAMPPMAMIATVSADNNDGDDHDNDEQPRADRVGRKDRHESRNLSVEERLDRIERTLEKLQSHERAQVFTFKPGQKVGADISVQPKIAFNYDWVADQANRAADQAKRAADAGMRAAEAGKRAAEQAMRDMQRAQNKEMLKWQSAQSQMPERELEALREARNSLQDQVHSLESQIKRLEEQREQMKRHVDGKHVDGKDDGEGKGHSSSNANSNSSSNSSDSKE